MVNNNNTLGEKYENPLETINPYKNRCQKLRGSIEGLEKEILQMKKKPAVSTGLAPYSTWDVDGDNRMHSTFSTLLVARVISKLPDDDEPADASKPASSLSALAEEANSKLNDFFSSYSRSASSNPKSKNRKLKYLIELAHIGKYVSGLDDSIDPSTVEEGVRVGVDRRKYKIKLVLPTKVDLNVSLMELETKPDVTYEDIGGCEEQLERIREIVELPMTSPEKFVSIGVEPPKGVLLYGPPGTGKTLLAKAVANRTNATFIRVIGSELAQKFVGEGARLVREIFKLARSKEASILFLDEIDAIGGSRGGSGDGDDEVHRTMLQILTELDGFSARGNIKVIMATNRPDTLDKALLRPGRIDRKIEFGLPDLKGRKEILEIHAAKMAVKGGIRWELLARLCPNASGAELRSICTEAGMFCIRAARRVVTEQDFVRAISKVTKEYSRFSSAPQYLLYN